jgi:predicted PurR-regulated permease PerM
MVETGKKAFVATLVAVAVIVTALALWKLKLIISLLFLAVIIAAAMQPGIDALRRRGIPRGFGILIHYAGLFGAVGLLLWLVVPRARDQIAEAIGNLPTATKNSTGIKHEILKYIQNKLNHLPSGGSLVHPALTIGVKAFEVLIGIFFTFAAAAYWTFERTRAQRLVTSLLPRPKRKVVWDTWNLIDLKLGAFVRGELLLIVLVGTVLSIAFRIIGLPYWLLVGIFAGLVEIVPVIGPLTAGAVAVGVGLTDSWQTALAAGICVLVVRLLEDYIIIPKVLGEAVGLSPLVVLVAVAAVGILFGGFAVLLAVPFAAVLATLVDVVLLDKDPAEEEVPTVLFPAKDAEAQ